MIVGMVANIFDVTDDNFEAKVINASTPTVVEFCTTWAGACRTFAPVYERASTQWVNLGFARLDTHANPASASQWGIQSVPTIVLFCAGDEVARVAAPSPAQFNSDLEKWRTSCPPPSYWPAPK